MAGRRCVESIIDEGTRSEWNRGSCHVGNCCIESAGGKAVVVWVTVCGCYMEDRYGEGYMSGAEMSSTAVRGVSM